MTQRKGQIMRLKDAACRNCYKCVRICPVNAISLTEDQACIEEERCIFCGKCYMVCPQDARDIIGDEYRVKGLIKNGKKVYASISSAFSTYFSSSSLKQMGAVLKKLGFFHVEETAVGGNRIISEYTDIIKKKELTNLISTMCPSTNYMIQKYFPDLVKWMCPVDTPLEAHAKMMKAAYGDDIEVVGIGPCIAGHRLTSSWNTGSCLSAYLTYEELENWMNEDGIEIGDEDPDTFPVSDYRGRYLDEEGGIFRALPSDIKYEYKLWEISGASRTKDMLKGMNAENTDGNFMVISACANHCLGGPIVRLAHRDTFESKDRWLRSIKEGDDNAGFNLSENADVDVRKEFLPMTVEIPEVPPATVKYYLSLIGRNKAGSMLDCAGCGYNTCIEKAKAAAQGMADPYMCIPHSREKAEARSNHLFDNSPSGVVVMDRAFSIMEVNPVAETILGISAGDAKNRNMADFIDPEFLGRAVMKEVRSVHERTLSEPLQKLLDLTFFRVEGHDFYMLLMDDRTEIAARLEKEQRIREETMDVTKKVVEKQMRIAQEIASLLGETTAETKLALNRLKNTLELDEESRWT